jgi:hypothetical protein
MGLSLQCRMQRKVDEGTEQNSKALCYLYFSYSTCDGGGGQQSIKDDRNSRSTERTEG